MKLDKGNKRGISLIVLVITIIVMIILAAAIILSLNSSGIIGKANKAKLSADEANMKEAAGVAYAEYQLEKQMGELEDPTQSAEKYVKDKLEDQFTEDTLAHLSILSDGTIQTIPTIPSGFVMSPYEGEQKISDGLVVYETTAADLENKTNLQAMEAYNQYVWIPVEGAFERIPCENVYLTTEYVEPLRAGIKNMDDISNYADEISQYNAMKASVETNGGFYIARYEAGLPEGKTTNDVKIDGTDKPISKKNANIWNNILFDATLEFDWSELKMVSGTAYGDDSENGAAKVSKYAIVDPNTSSNVISHLIYGVQWDAAMNFMKDKDNPNVPDKKYVEDATGMGWYGEGNSERKTGIDIGESAANKVKNIYDMAGNIKEWTYEAFINDVIWRSCSTWW